MNVKCPHCRNEFEVELTASPKPPSLPDRYRWSVEWLHRNRDTTAPPVILPPSKPDPDRPVGR